MTDIPLPSRPPTPPILSWPSTQAMIQDLEDTGNTLSEIVIGHVESERHAVGFDKNHVARLAIASDILREMWLQLCYKKGSSNAKETE
jgi:hypothetical protein